MQLVEKLRSNFAKNLTKLREQKQLTQEGLANAINERYHLGLKRTSIANYESQAQEAMPKIEALYCLADFFGKTIDQLVQHNMETQVLLHPWLAKEQGYHPEIQHPPVVLETEAAGVLNRLLNDNAKLVAVKLFYMEFVKKLQLQLKDSASSPEERDRLVLLLKKTYLSCLIEKSKTIQEKAHMLLDEQEYQIWIGFQEGASAQTLANTLNIPETKVLETFYNAKAKLEHSIDQTTA